MEQNYWEAEDKKYIWHPAMQMKDNEVFPPVVIDHAKGSYLYGTTGKNIWILFHRGGVISLVIAMKKSMRP